MSINSKRGTTGFIRDLRDEIRLLKNLPRRPATEPEPASQHVKVALEDVSEGTERRGNQAHTVRDIVFHAEEITW